MAKTLTVYLAADLKKFSSGMTQAENQVTGFAGKLSNMMGPALLAAGAAAGAFAAKLAVDGVKAAMDDEAAVASLARTMENLNLAHDTQAVEDYIYQLERSLGVADTELRPAYDRLIRSIGDVGKANDALSLALDISAGTGKDLQTVVEALGKAYDGNTGGLSRLGAGIDAATLKTRDMEAITAKLAETFGGQANVQAQTFQGQMQRLQTAVDNVAEAFGAGLLGALEDTNETSQDLVDTMGNLEPAMKTIGEIAGGELADGITKVAVAAEILDNVMTAFNDTGDDSIQWLEIFKGAVQNAVNPLSQFVPLLLPIAEGLGLVETRTRRYTSATVQAAIAAGEAKAPIIAVGDAADGAGDDAQVAAVKFANLGEAMAAVGGKTFNWRAEVAGATDDARKWGETLENQVIDRKYDERLARINAATNGNSRATGGATTATEGLTKENKKLTKAYEAQSEVFKATEQNLKDQVTELERAAAAVRDYASGIQDDLLGGISLEAAYKGQFTKEGELTGISLVEGFNRQIDQAEWFGNVLNAIKAKGADQTLVEEIASLGPGIGGALGQQLLDDGLVPTMSERWSHVQEVTAGLADGLVPEFLRAGVQSGIETVNGLAEQLSQEGARLAKLGKKIAKPVGASFKAQIAQDVADAIAQAQAAGTAARAEAYAKEQARQAAITEQQIAQAVGQLIVRQDARAGKPVAGSMGIVFT